MLQAERVCSLACVLMVLWVVPWCRLELASRALCQGKVQALKHIVVVVFELPLVLGIIMIPEIVLAALSLHDTACFPPQEMASCMGVLWNWLQACLW